jgi:uncharacterized protein (DUF111 family)
MEEQVVHNYELLIGIAGSVIGILLIVIGFFLRQFMNSVNSLREVMFDIKIIIESQKLELSNHKISCEARHTHISQKLQSITDQINKHHDNITVLKEKIK